MTHHKALIFVLLAALAAAPEASQASELTRRLTIRYPGQDAKNHHRRDHWQGRREHDHHHGDREGRRSR